ncbi:MAG: CheR family methyltransferase [Bacteroidales bacterium]
MRFEADALGLSPTGSVLLRDLIHGKIGLYYDDGRTNQLLDKLAPLVIARGFDSFLDYYYLLRYDPAADDEWGRVFDALAVPETYFWREMDQVLGVVGEVVPKLARRFDPVRIWSVPCASGEEPLSIAMALAEAGWFDRAAVEIHASDASPAAIARARAGRYRERSFRALPAALREKYFSADADAWKVDEALHRRITWSTLNVLDTDRAAPLAASPVVFCRNMLIYFSQESLVRVLDLFLRHMPAPGYLCLGASESLLRYTTRFELEQLDGAYVYVKR